MKINSVLKTVGLWLVKFPKPKNAITYNLDNCILFVRIIGLEPTRLAAPDPKSGMSTNFTISAQLCMQMYY